MWESPTYRQEWQVTSTYFNKNLLHSSAQYDLSQVDRSIEAVATLLCLAGGDIIQCCLSHIYIGDVYQVFVWCLKKKWKYKSGVVFTVKRGCLRKYDYWTWECARKVLRYGSTFPENRRLRSVWVPRHRCWPGVEGGRGIDSRVVELVASTCDIEKFYLISQRCLEPRWYPGGGDENYVTSLYRVAFMHDMEMFLQVDFCYRNVLTGVNEQPTPGDDLLEMIGISMCFLDQRRACLVAS